MYKSILLLAATTLLPSVTAFCCSGPQCADGTGGTPCCATQSCNIFCCACGGVCRGSGKRELLAAVRAEDPTVATFQSANTAADGKLTLDQFLGWAATTGKGFNDSVWEEHFNKFDKEGKGYVTIEEAGSRE